MEDAILQNPLSHLYLGVFNIHKSIFKIVYSTSIRKSTMHGQVLDEKNQYFFQIIEFYFKKHGFDYFRGWLCINPLKSVHES